jgi:uncharacterized protein (DUF1800 family)
MDTAAAHAMIRFGLGRRGDEPAPPDPRGWLANQLEGFDPGSATPCHSGAEGVLAIRDFNRAKDKKMAGQALRAIFRADSDAAIDTLLTTASPFRERLVWFWANHFTVSVRRPFTGALVNAMIQEAIRPHVTGRFADMPKAVTRHPAMLLYLDNAGSVGPDSRAGMLRHRGLNENLARECMELHTVTPVAGYTQADVTAFARLLTGWSIGFEEARPGFRFRPFAHEPGPQRMMGHEFPSGERGGLAALDFLAAHPACHHNLALKLARHFIADTPPAEAVAALAGVLGRTGGDLKAAALALLGLKEAWRPLTKLRTPFDYVVAVLRALDLPADRRPDVPGVMAGLGQGLHDAPLPNGWPDDAADWAAPEAMMRRVDWAYGVSARAPGRDPAALARESLGPLLSDATGRAVAGAGSRREAMTLLLAAPEFQRR